MIERMKIHTKKFSLESGILIALLAMACSSSTDSAFSKQEKIKQDSIDNATNEGMFEELTTPPSSEKTDKNQAHTNDIELQDGSTTETINQTPSNNTPIQTR